MSVTRISTRIATRTGGVQHAAFPFSRRAIPAHARSYASQGSEPPRSQSKPAQPGETKTWMPITGVGLALGACFCYLMAKPNNAPKVAHATGRNLPELTGRDVVDPKEGRRMGTWKSD